MKMFHNNKESKKAKKAIELFFRKGGRLTTDQVITEYFDPRTPLNVIIAKQIATRWICEITQLLNKEGQMFGRLNKAGEYGLVKTRAEAESVATRAYTITKGHV